MENFIIIKHGLGSVFLPIIAGAQIGLGSIVMDLKAPAQRVFQQPTSIDGLPVTVARISNECDNAIVETELKIAFEVANKCSGQLQSRKPIYFSLPAQYSSFGVGVLYRTGLVGQSQTLFLLCSPCAK